MQYSWLWLLPSCHQPRHGQTHIRSTAGKRRTTTNVDLHCLYPETLITLLRKAVCHVLPAVDHATDTLPQMALGHHWYIEVSSFLYLRTLRSAVFLVVFMLFTLFTLVLGCIPVQASWDFSLRPPPMGTGNAKCFSLGTYRNIAFVNSSKIPLRISTPSQGLPI